MTIGIIGGGNMAEAIIAGLLHEKSKSIKIIVSEPNANRRDFLVQKFKSIKVVSENIEIFNALPKAVILAVKPQIFNDLLNEISAFTTNQILISIAAGINSSTIKKKCPNAKVVRVMPNTPFLALAGCGGVSFEPNFTQAEKEMVLAIFNNSGELIELPEDKMHAVTAISGSGPAYFFYFTEELIKAGILSGLTPEESKTLAIKTLFGAGKLLLESSDSAETLRKKVTSPNGTTEAAINSFMANKTGEMIDQAVKAAIKRSKELAGEA